MESKPSLQILIVSGACCSPNLIRQDQMLEKVLSEAIKDLNLTVEIQKVSLSHALHSSDHLTPKQHQQILALFRTYNTRFTPALFLGDEVRFAGKIPSFDQVKEALSGNS
jgi:hypothetical protein